MQDPYNPRRDIEKFLAMGDGSFDALLDMLDREPGMPPVERTLQTPGSLARLPHGYRLEYGSDALILRRVDGSFAAAFSPQGLPQRPSGGPPRKIALGSRPTRARGTRALRETARKNADGAPVGEVLADGVADARRQVKRPDYQGSALEVARRVAGGTPAVGLLRAAPVPQVG